MKSINHLLFLISLVLMTGCSNQETNVSPYSIGTPMEEVDEDLKSKGITPLVICDYYFYQYENKNHIIQKSSDLKSVLKSESVNIPEPTRAELSLIQYGMSPFEVVSLIGLPLSYEFIYSEYLENYSYNIAKLTFKDENDKDAEFSFFYYNDYLYCCCPDYDELWIYDVSYNTSRR